MPIKQMLTIVLACTRIFAVSQPVSLSIIDDNTLDLEGDCAKKAVGDTCTLVNFPGKCEIPGVSGNPSIISP